ncbi:MAG: ferredoxin--NADP reductase [Pyrinomonadaceae bacterium]|nr:ferredoxin--NADP reductase [Pyrinomonadaceae bacterium]
MQREKSCSAELIERRNVSDALAIFRFHTADQLFFTAGQYATIAIETDGDLLERPYSIVSSPYERFLEFFVELVPGGLLTPKLWDMSLGSSILVRRRIVGQFTLDRAVNRHLMMATVTGVAPFVSMLRTQRIDRERGVASSDQLVVIHGASRSAEFGPYLSELETLSRDGWLEYIPTISRPWEELGWLGETGRVEDVVRKHADRLGYNHTNSVAYACGHPQMIQKVKEILLRARFPKGQIREEDYFVLHDSKERSKRCAPHGLGNSSSTSGDRN